MLQFVKLSPPLLGKRDQPGVDPVADRGLFDATGRITPSQPKATLGGRETHVW